MFSCILREREIDENIDTQEIMLFSYRINLNLDLEPLRQASKQVCMHITIQHTHARSVLVEKTWGDTNSVKAAEHNTTQQFGE